MEINSVMGIKNFFSGIFLLATAMGFSQEKTFNNSKNEVPATLFTTTKSDTIVVSTIAMLAKMPSETLPAGYKVNILSESFNWAKDVRNAESFKNMAMDRKQDGSGRDMPTDLHSEVIQRVYLNTPTDR